MAFHLIADISVYCLCLSYTYFVRFLDHYRYTVDGNYEMQLGLIQII
jgi:hypothetical protein